MQINKRGAVAALMMATLALSPLAEAKRMGGGKSYGMSRNNSSASRSNSRPATPPPQQQTAPQRSGPGVGGMVAAGVAGAAIGAVAANAMADNNDPTTTPDPATTNENTNVTSTAQPDQKKGFGWWWIIVSAMAAFFIFRRFSAKKAAANNGTNPFAPNNGGSQRQSLNSSASAAPLSHGSATASTRGTNTNIFGQTVGSAPSMGGAFSNNGNQLADGTEPAAFLRQARAKFLHLQSMNSSSNIEEVRRYFTPDMYSAIREDILSNDDLAEFPNLSAQVLESSQENGQYVASVEFSGTVSESVHAQAVPFTEVWHFVKPQNSSEWLVAGIQQP